MFQNEIPELARLKNENYENIFKVKQTEDGFYFYNLLETLHFPENLPSNYFTDYNVVYGDTWPLIAYKKYKNIKLWWIITHANNVINPINQPVPGTVLKIPIPNVVSDILTEIVTQES